MLLAIHYPGSSRGLIRDSYLRYAETKVTHHHQLTCSAARGPGYGGTILSFREQFVRFAALLEKDMARKPAATTPSHKDRMKWFMHDRFGMFIHWGIYAIPARGEWVRNREEISVEKYQPYFDEFDPARYDPAKWAAIAKAAGQKYVVMTAKHHDGFCLFDSKLTDYKSTNTPARRDLVREYVDAMRGAGLKVGFYYSLLDWHHPDYPCDEKHPMRNNTEFKAQRRKFSRYVDYLHGQVRELLTNYGKIDVIWFDFSYGELSGEAWRAKELVKMVRSLQPGIIIDNRLTAGHTNIDRLGELGDFASPEQIIPSAGVVDSKGRPVPWEACITMNGAWGYNRDDKNFKPAATIVRMMVECVSKGGNLLLNVGPTAKGEIQPECVDLLAQVGHWMAANGASVYGCGNANLPKPEWGYYTTDGKTLYAHIINRPVGPIALVGLGGKVSRARMLRDGSEVNISRPWMVGSNSTDAFMQFGGASLPDPLDTVVALTLG
jgi:alpha-L-fucosidase